MVTATEPTAVGNNLTAQLLYVDVASDGIALTFSFRCADTPCYIPYAYAKPTRNPNAPEPIYILDDNGTTLSTTSGWMGGRRSVSPGFWSFPAINLKPGERVELSAKFPPVSAGSGGFKFVSPTTGVYFGSEWNWPEVKIKRDLFE